MPSSPREQEELGLGVVTLKNAHPKHIEVPTAMSSRIDDCQLSAIPHEEAAADDDDESLTGTSIHSLHTQDQSTTIQLSLPESFDDTFTLSSVLQPLHPAEGRDNLPPAADSQKQLPRMERAGGCRKAPATTEVDILRAKLQEAGTTIRSLRFQMQTKRDNLRDIKVNDEDHARLSRIPREDLTLEDFVSRKKSAFSSRGQSKRRRTAKRMLSLCVRHYRKWMGSLRSSPVRRRQIGPSMNQRDLRACHESTVLDCTKATANLERELANARSDVKVKTFENANLVTTHEALKDDLRTLQSQNDSLRDQVEAHRQELSNLKQERTTERQKLNDEISRKDEQLEMYLQAELRIESTVDAGKHPGEESLLSSPKRRIQQAVALARKCAELKKSEESIRTDLELQQEANEELAAKLKTSEALLADMKQPSAYVVESMRAKEEELCQLRSENQLLQTELATAKKERSILTRQLSEVLERRQQLEEMKGIVKDLKYHHQQPAMVPNRSQKSRADDDLSIHTVHHETPIAAQSTRWHACIAE